jgi:hypothetical protein
MFRLEYIKKFHLRLDRLESTWVSDRRMEFAAFGDGPEKGIVLTDLSNRNQRPAIMARMVREQETAYCKFESLMDFQKFESALESHGCRDVNPRKRR